MIRSYANELEDSEMPLNMICDHITKALKGLVTARYVQEYLEEKYKDPSKVESNSRRTSSSDDNKNVLE